MITNGHEERYIKSTTFDDQVESILENLFETKIKWATKTEDMYQHIDLWIDNIPVGVRGQHLRYKRFFDNALNLRDTEVSLMFLEDDSVNKLEPKLFFVYLFDNGKILNWKLLDMHELHIFTLRQRHENMKLGGPKHEPFINVYFNEATDVVLLEQKL